MLYRICRFIRIDHISMIIIIISIILVRFCNPQCCYFGNRHAILVLNWTTKINPSDDWLADTHARTHAHSLSLSCML